MLKIEQALASSSLLILRDEISRREDEIQFHTCNPNVVNRLNQEIIQLRAKAYQIINAQTRGKVTYMAIPGLA